MPNFRLPEARWPVLRKPKPQAWAKPTPPRFRSVGPNARPLRPNPKGDPLDRHFPNNQRNSRENSMIDRKNRYGRTAARVHDADGLARRPSSTTIDIHAHIDHSRVPLAHFADAETREINAQQEKDVEEVMTTIDRRLFELDRMGIDIQVVAPAPPQCYYTIDSKIAEKIHRLANDGVAEFCARKSDRFVGLGVVNLQEPELAVRELDYVMKDLKLNGVEILTNVDGQELSDPKFRPFFARAEQLGAFIMMHPNG